ncbi:MAG: AMP-binding protein [Desulfomicrobium escambiense]|nr:AMP-binding protein [Desulfomicrobium escambiense]
MPAIYKVDRRAPLPARPDRDLRGGRGRPPAVQAEATGGRRARASRRPPPATTSASGSTPRARPARPKGAVHSHARPARHCAELYAQGVLGLDRGRRRASRPPSCSSPTASGNAHVPSRCAVGGTRACCWPERPTPEARLRPACARHKPTIFFGVPTLYAAHARLAAAGPRRAAADPDGAHALASVRLCVSAGEALPAELGQRFKRALRRRDPRRHRLDRDAAHLPLQPARRGALRHAPASRCRATTCELRRRRRPAGRRTARSATCYVQRPERGA